MLQSTSYIPTRPTPASRSVIPSNSTPNSRPLCVFEMPPILLTGPFMPDADFQTNRLAVLCPPPKPIGLGLDCIDSGLSRSQLQLPPIHRRIRTIPALHSRVSRTSSSFDCEKSMASMNIDTNSISLPPATSPVASAFHVEEPEFNSLYDLDVQYHSSRSLSTVSPQSALNYSYSPATLSPSWSLDSILSISAFSSPKDISPPSSISASWASSSKLSLSNVSVKAEATSEESLLAPDMAVSFGDISIFRNSAGIPDFSSVNPAYITLDHPHPPLPPVNDILKFEEDDVFKSTEFSHYHYNSFTSSLIPTSPELRLPKMCDDESDYIPTPVPSSRMVLPIPSVLPLVLPPPRILKRKSSTENVPVKKKAKKEEEEERVVVLGTPILDAHRGITQAELEAKAARYRQRNPGIEDFDKRWLASFSGKLSVTGELMDNFRCYVAGCTQVNKRQDHMVVHVGAHLDQRPFKCDHWRKNELKRHESSHDRSRPFVCPHCPVTFRRQDLLARHLKNKHAPGKENLLPRKKAKLS